MSQYKIKNWQKYCYFVGAFQELTKYQKLIFASVIILIRESIKIILGYHILYINNECLAFHFLLEGIKRILLITVIFIFKAIYTHLSVLHLVSQSSLSTFNIGTSEVLGFFSHYENFVSDP